MLAREVAVVPQVPVTIGTRGPVAVVTVDNGADNTIDVNIVDSLVSAFKTVQEHAGAVVLAGRPGWYSRGLDSDILQAGGAAASRLLDSSTELILRLVEFPRPLVAACTGTALGAAAATLLACDYRVGTAGDFKIGLDFVSVGVPVPDLVVELARVRLSPKHITRACNTAELYSPDAAIQAGFLDAVTAEDAVERACEVAADLSQRVDRRAFEVTRETTSRSVSETIMRSAGDLWRYRRDSPTADGR